jgi:hypothetical protein
MKKLQFSILACLMLLIPSLSHAEGWVWMGYYPWVWSCEQDAWLHLTPAGPEGFRVWNDSTQEMETSVHT